jgi:diacylglycerol kinase family enzyme
MRYAIITNPSSGRMTVDRKRFELAKAAQILDAQIHGLDTGSAQELAQCARGLAARYDILVAAGGDGTFSDIINAVDPAQTPVAYLPLGTGNAMRYALKYKGDLIDIAMRIRDGRIHNYDLINCDDKKRAFTISVGIEGTVIRLRDRYVAQGAVGLKPYLKAVLRSYLKEYKYTDARITIDGEVFAMKNLLSLMIVKHPYYGYGMNVVPEARFHDGRMHICCLDSGLFKSLLGGITAFTIGNRIGQYYTGSRLTVKLDRPLALQYNGNSGWEADAFTFEVLPGALKIKC